ncbi:ctr copper transporter [Colletotrichum paranaense]|uniref:Copper transport protein n=13 Tax=Colletotrichum acutatum species complex TaxID=2707335 RepID=A0A135V921_9PEZI|nr:ctr copper transporter [Colletotrichum lupini]XP_060321017.1 ctr copper transporter [Colletotrichum costaricense]XP_060347020.1 ctr copper transporter [Colletotrichum paranaense]XP_060371469.1 ctr copper transporter [Colletotrichum acutatum]XP_060382456.1 ctr copper transporter [Colletotrichum tamarilloi]XP_060392493.1 ctr copper transporter [Colletotrichum abscissum]XP_060437182.1 ctr copper transporter [Colletotrichum godetiae]KAI3545376.1 ctr copper transporter [Colletotrichum filicis]
MDSFLMARHGGDDHGATGTATASDAMPGMDMGSGTMNDTHGSTGSSMSMMMMTIFQTSLKTPLYTEAWTPNSVGTYAATCIFLIFLAFGLRSMLALKSIQEKRWLDKDFKRRYVSVNGKLGMAGKMSTDSMAKQMVLSENGLEENVTVVQKGHGIWRPWRFSVDPVRAVIDTAIAGVGYLLMLAVMTMNVGYLLSVLGGVFLGSLAVGRFATMGEH